MGTHLLLVYTIVDAITSIHSTNYGRAKGVLFLVQLYEPSTSIKRTLSSEASLAKERSDYV